MKETGRFRRIAIASALCSVALSGIFVGSARADEPQRGRSIHLFDETAEVTQVADAFDGDNPFDIRATLGFRQQWKSAKIRRESNLTQPGLATGGFVATNENVASFSEQTSILDVGVEVGLWKDLAFYFHLPLILSNSRALDDLNGSTSNPQRFMDPTGSPLFTVPFKSPTRSGLDWFAIGLHYDITNQSRSPWLPTWLIGLEARFGVGPRLHACNDGAAVKCPDPVNPGIDRNAGISRGMNAYIAHTVVSRRIGYVEPYMGVRAMLEDPQSNSDFGSTIGAKGNILTRPPVVGSILVGAEVVPWERRDTFQRLAIDAHVLGEYHSPGRDYTEMFDALGSSQAPSLRSPNPGGYKVDAADPNRSVADPAAPSAYFSGITDQQAFTTLTGGTRVTYQAAEFVKFSLSLGLTYASSHAITAGDACNPSVTNDPGASGPCRSARSPTSLQVTGIPNPNYRAVIDAPGHRLIADDTTIVHFGVSGTLMF